MGIIILGFMAIVGLDFLGFWIYLATRRGEDCPRYPYDCAYCRHVAECIIKIGRKKDGDNDT